MTRSEALASLSASSAHDRLKAARFLVRNATAADLQALRDALRRETVSYVRASLEVAAKRASHAAAIARDPNVLDEIEVPPDVRTHIRNEATAEIAGRLLHEVASPVGLVASAAAREIPDYENSSTKRHIDTLKRIFDAIAQLRSAVAVPRPEEFDLAELISEVVAEATNGHAVGVSLHGSRPMLIRSDPGVLRLALSNGIRNAVEATRSTVEDARQPIVVTWGVTDVDYWVAVLDGGPGLVGPAESAFGVGKTTKKGHTGFGLTIARHAIETLGGACSLQPATDGGARFEVRWER